MATAPTVDYRARALNKLSQLPPFSPILLRLMATLAREDVSFAELAQLIERDTVMAGNVLRMVNSALYGRRGTVNSVAHAIAIMGLHKLRNYTLGVSISSTWSRLDLPPLFSLRAFNLHSVGTAILADHLALEIGIDGAESAFSAGLFHDLGKLLIAISAPQELLRIYELYRERGAVSVVECEREVLGCDHAELSASVVAKWNLPAAIQRAVREHHHLLPEQVLPESRTLAALVNGASDAVKAAGYSIEPDPEGKPDPASEALGAILDIQSARNACDVMRHELDVLRNFL